VPPDHPGLFLATAETAQPAQLLSALRKALTVAATTAPTTEEVERAREESLNSFIFGFTSTGAQLRRSVAFELLGIPQDYPFTYRNKLTKVTAEDIKAAAQRHLHPDKMVTLVVGDAKVIKPQIEKTLGVSVEMLKLEEDKGM
jgi:zinc protease